MAGGRAKLPVLAEISGSATGEGPAWSLRDADFERLAPVRERLEGQSPLLVSGERDLVGVLAVALAAGVAACGRRTVLLDCDLARPRLAADLGLQPTPGLHEYLRWEATPAQVLQPLALGGPIVKPGAEPLICIAAGRQVADPATLLGLKSFSHMTAKLRSAYDLVVLAGPPLDAEPGSLSPVAAQADCVLLALAPERAKGRALRAVRSELSRHSIGSIGSVVVDGP